MLLRFYTTLLQVQPGAANRNGPDYGTSARHLQLKKPPLFWSSGVMYMAKRRTRKSATRHRQGWYMTPAKSK
jgi:hypothetical protein